jgi:hypothetical protein
MSFGILPPIKQAPDGVLGWGFSSTSSITKYRHGRIIQVPGFVAQHLQSVPINTFPNTIGFLLCFHIFTATPDRPLCELMAYSYIHKKTLMSYDE